MNETQLRETRLLIKSGSYGLLGDGPAPTERGQLLAALEADVRARWAVRVLDAKGGKSGAPAAYWYDEGLPDYYGWFHPWMPDGASTVATPDAGWEMHRAAVAQLEADAQALANVRTLDDDASTTRHWRTEPVCEESAWRCTQGALERRRLVVRGLFSCPHPRRRPREGRRLGERAEVMRNATKRTWIAHLSQAAYACLGAAAYGPRLWAGVALVLSVIALVLNERTPREDSPCTCNTHRS